MYRSRLEELGRIPGAEASSRCFSQVLRMLSNKSLLSSSLTVGPNTSAGFSVSPAKGVLNPPPRPHLATDATQATVRRCLPLHSVSSSESIHAGPTAQRPHRARRDEDAREDDAEGDEGLGAEAEAETEAVVVSASPERRQAGGSVSPPSQAGGARGPQIVVGGRYAGGLLIPTHADRPMRLMLDGGR